jgi:hypothetical protein
MPEVGLEPIPLGGLFALERRGTYAPGKE